jgi:hypothetical protein
VRKKSYLRGLVNAFMIFPIMVLYMFDGMNIAKTPNPYASVYLTSYESVVVNIS